MLVRYGGIATPVIDPDGSLDGFIPTDDGAFVASEPRGSPTWYPANDTPTDKATFTVAITVPTGITAISNGDELGSWTRSGLTSSPWHIGQPISTYLVTATLGRFTVPTGNHTGWHRVSQRSRSDPGRGIWRYNLGEPSAW